MEEFIKNVVTFYPIVFLVAALIAIIALIVQSSRMHANRSNGRYENQSTMRIDVLIHNRNSGVPTAAVVDTLIKDKIVYCGVEDRT